MHVKFKGIDSCVVIIIILITIIIYNYIYIVVMSLPDFFSIFFLLIIEAKSGTITDQLSPVQQTDFTFHTVIIGKRTC